MTKPVDDVKDLVAKSIKDIKEGQGVKDLVVEAVEVVEKGQKENEKEKQVCHEPKPEVVLSVVDDAL